MVGPTDYRGFGGDAGVAAGFRRKPWLAPAVLASMARALRRAAQGADLVHAHWLASVLVAPLARKPVVLTLHGSGTAGRFEDRRVLARPRAAKMLLHGARVVIAVSSSSRTGLARLGRATSAGSRTASEIPEQVGAEAEPAEVLYLGRLSEEKGIRGARRGECGLNLVVAGDGRSARSSRRRSASSRPPRPSVSSPAPRWSSSSHREGLPTVLLEALAHGRAVVATPVGGIPSLVEDGVTGLLVPTGDPGALREAIDRLLANPELLAGLGETGRARVTELCSWPRGGRADRSLRGGAYFFARKMIVGTAGRSARRPARAPRAPCARSRPGPRSPRSAASRPRKAPST